MNYGEGSYQDVMPGHTLLGLTHFSGTVQLLVMLFDGIWGNLVQREACTAHLHPDYQLVNWQLHWYRNFEVSTLSKSQSTADESF